MTLGMNHIINGVCSPEWFLWKDIIIDTIILLIVIFILYGIIKYMKISRKKEYKTMVTAFELVSLSFLLKIIVNSFIYTMPTFPGWDFWNMHFMHSLLILAFIISRVLFAIGVLYWYKMYYKPSSHSLFLIASLVVIALYFTRSQFYILHMVLVLFLFFIVKKALFNFEEKKGKLSMIIASSFILFFLSQIFFMFLEFNLMFYVIGEIFQLLGYLFMVSTLIVVKMHGKKKKSLRHC